MNGGIARKNSRILYQAVNLDITHEILQRSIRVGQQFEVLLVLFSGIDSANKFINSSCSFIVGTFFEHQLDSTLCIGKTARRIFLAIDIERAGIRGID